MRDLVSRQAAIDAHYEYCNKHPDAGFPVWSLKILEYLPSAQLERKKGKWIYGESEAGNDGYYCSKCGNFVPWKYDEYDIDFIKEFLFCNKCGADMREDGATNADVES